MKYSETIGKAAIDAFREGRDKAVNNLRAEREEQDIILACKALTEAEVVDEEIMRLIGKYWDLRPSEAEYILGLSREN